MSYTPVYYPAKKQDVTNLDQDLRSSRLSKYNNPKLQQDIKNWIAAILKGQINEQELRSSDLMDFLKDGTVLGQLITTIWGPSSSFKFKQSKMAFVQMENIEKFLNFIKAQGVPQDELFQTVDLYEAKDPYQVLMTIQSFSRLINKQFGNQYPIIGPTLSTKHERPKVPPKPKHFSASTGAAWSSMEYGYMNGSNQNTEKVVFGGRRDIVHKN